MKVDRQEVLKALTVASVGLTKREILEQSNAFVFVDGEVITFNGEILTRGKSPLEIEGAVPAEDLLKILSKLPDEEVDIRMRSGEMIVKGKRRSAGITRMSDVHLPFEDVPKPKKFRPIPEVLMGVLRQAAYVCGRDETQPRTTEVHVTPSMVESSDNYRLFRYEAETGFREGALIPAASINAIGPLTIEAVSQRGGWVHFRVPGGATLSLRGSVGDYPDLGPHLELDSPEKVILPRNLADILARAEVMQDSDYDAIVDVTIADGMLTLKASKDSGWYRESKRIKYDGRPLRFHVHPRFLADVLQKTNKVLIREDRLKLVAGEAVFVVCLEVV